MKAAIRIMMMCLLLTGQAAHAAQAGGGQCIIRVSADPADEGKTLCVTGAHDPLTGERDTLCMDVVGERGRCEIGVAVREAEDIEIDWGRVKIGLWVREGKTYELNLPRQETTTEAERNNPFFEKTFLRARLWGADENNRLADLEGMADYATARAALGETDVWQGVADLAAAFDGNGEVREDAVREALRYEQARVAAVETAHEFENVMKVLAKDETRYAPRDGMDAFGKMMRESIGNVIVRTEGLPEQPYFVRAIRERNVAAWRAIAGYRYGVWDAGVSELMMVGTIADLHRKGDVSVRLLLQEILPQLTDEAAVRACKVYIAKMEREERASTLTDIAAETADGKPCNPMAEREKKKYMLAAWVHSKMADRDGTCAVVSALAEQYGKHLEAVVMVCNPMGSNAERQKWAAENETRRVKVRFVTEAEMKRHDIRALPCVMLVDREGKIVEQTEAAEDETFEVRMVEHLNGIKDEPKGAETEKWW